MLDSDGGMVEAPLRRELALAQRYLAIEQIRFGDRLRVRVNADPDVMDAPAPIAFPLQPIMSENAARHRGIEADPNASLTIEIEARRDGGP